ncbi:uncharacterized transmembrane protein DDB_G0289901-like [Daktulosphaira vitifoliae]|uniref:uncharacterized transmembrane protein DDB_G0289901-like n=1 Tax=Daktulosphaira vitifoliae TaxID=58002 RepID=UPI0021AA1FF1|nr:uncharacterized transmembrane protein DDB_G0289901-like [Daktulosphaira vitifoliae]
MKAYINLCLTIIILQTFHVFQQTRANQGLDTNISTTDVLGSTGYANRVPMNYRGRVSTDTHNVHEVDGANGGNTGYGVSGGNTGYGVSGTSGGNTGYGVSGTSGGNTGYGARNPKYTINENGIGEIPNVNSDNRFSGVSSGNTGYGAREPNYINNGNRVSEIPNTNSGYGVGGTTSMKTGNLVRDTTNTNYVNGVSGTSVANDQTNTSSQKEMINQSRKQLMESLKTTGANRVVDVLDTASIATKVADNVMTGITDLNHNGLSLTNRVAMRKIQMGGKAMNTAASGVEGLISGVEQIGGAGVEATKSVYNPAVATTANMIRGSGRVIAIPIKVAKTVTGFIGGERTNTATPVAAVA